MWNCIKRHGGRERRGEGETGGMQRRGMQEKRNID